MRKILICVITTLCSLSTLADDVTPGITVSKTDGSSTLIPLCELQSIRFNEGIMVINKKDNKQHCLAVDEITVITFEDISTAVNVLTSKNPANGNICITDLSGRVVYSGKVTDTGHSQLPAGIYVIRANSKSYKVMIK